jgi:hypothetical protein
MRVSWMSPCLSVEKNAFALIRKPMAFRQLAAEDEHRDVDAGAVDGDFRGVDAIDGCGDGRARGFVAGANSKAKLAGVPIWDYHAP